MVDTWSKCCLPGSWPGERPCRGRALCPHLGDQGERIGGRVTQGEGVVSEAGTPGEVPQHVLWVAVARPPLAVLPGGGGAARSLGPLLGEEPGGETVEDGGRRGAGEEPGGGGDAWGGGSGGGARPPAARGTLVRGWEREKATCSLTPCSRVEVGSRRTMQVTWLQDLR